MHWLQIRGWPLPAFSVQDNIKIDRLPASPITRLKNEEKKGLTKSRVTNPPACQSLAPTSRAPRVRPDQNVGP